jgi:HD-GYP domain-containing protein (c-di-GMP phosphodiesterase class II)
MLHDYTTYAHATRVCTYALLIAKSVGIYDRQALLGIATGALLHDVGKLFVADTIVAKNYRLTPPERERMREHPTQGFLRLSKREDLSWGTLMMVYQHHERVDGCGYPVGLCQSEIHEWARICAIANDYDALMRDTAMRDTAAMRKVLHNLELQSGRSLDEEFTRCWIETIRSSLPSA